MIIRSADTHDLPALVECAREFAVRGAPWTRLPDDDAMLRDILTRVMALSGVEILLAETEHAFQVVGTIAVLYTPYLWNPSLTVAEELFWITLRDAPTGTGARLF